MELKFGGWQLTENCLVCFNRTFMELKFIRAATKKFFFLF